MTLDQQAIAETQEAMRATGCRTPRELLKVLLETHTDPQDVALLTRDPQDWTVADVRHWLRLVTGYLPTDPTYRWGPVP